MCLFQIEREMEEVNLNHRSSRIWENAATIGDQRQQRKINGRHWCGQGQGGTTGGKAAERWQEEDEKREQGAAESGQQ